MPHNERGHEIPDQTPLEMPSGLRRPLSLHEEIRRFIRTELSQQAADNGVETFEEADDFEVDDVEPDDYLTPYTVVEMAPESLQDAPESLEGNPSLPDPIPPTQEATTAPPEGSSGG